MKDALIYKKKNIDKKDQNSGTSFSLKIKAFWQDFYLLQIEQSLTFIIKGQGEVRVSLKPVYFSQISSLG